MCKTIKGIQHPKFYALVNGQRKMSEIPATKVQDIKKQLIGQYPGKPISIREHGSNRLVVRIAKWI